MSTIKIPNICISDGCKSQKPIFGYKGGIPQFCKNHKAIGMVDIRNKLCENKDCGKRATYGFPGEKRRFCFKHIEKGMIDVVSKRCGKEGCDSPNPPFALTIKDKDRYCGKHKTSDMVYIFKRKLCNIENCKETAKYNVYGGKPLVCKNHKTDKMININYKLCKKSGCLILASYGFKNAYPEYCFSHKGDKMILLNRVYCKEEECDKFPSFGFKDSVVEYCDDHKKDKMVNLKTKLCAIDACDSPAYYNTKGNRPKYCIDHKTDKMVNTIHKLCNVSTCISRARYGIPGHPVLYCYNHREKGMIKRPNSKCKACKEPAIWGTNWVPKFCDKHKTEDSVNYTEKPCKSCGLMYILNSDNCCESCDPEKFKTVRLAKQNALMTYLDSRKLFGDSTDKIIDDGRCGKERPDRIYDFKDKIIILECDEHQHQERSCVCEQTRMVNIAQSFGGVPVYFIRWNPDEYLPKNERKHPELIKNRYTLVGYFIQSIKDNKLELPNAFVSALYMYYDGWDSIDEEIWNVILKYDI